MKTIEDLKKMIKEPASKEWFEKHGTPKSMALHKVKIQKHKPRMLSAEESKAKMSSFPKNAPKVDEAKYQKKFKRAYND